MGVESEGLTDRVASYTVSTGCIDGPGEFGIVAIGFEDREGHSRFPLPAGAVPAQSDVTAE